METKQKTKRELTPAAQCAKLIRGILKDEFPGQKFGVTSSNFSMGDSVNVEWTDGPTEDELNKLIGHFQYGHFDGMTDMYEYSNTRKDIPQTKYLQLNRHLSEEVIRDFAKKTNKEYGTNHQTEDIAKCFMWHGEYVSWYQLAWKKLREVSFYDN